MFFNWFVADLRPEKTQTRKQLGFWGWNQSRWNPFGKTFTTTRLNCRLARLKSSMCKYIFACEVSKNFDDISKFKIYIFLPPTSKISKIISEPIPSGRHIIQTFIYNLNVILQATANLLRAYNIRMINLAKVIIL